MEQLLAVLSTRRRHKEAPTFNIVYNCTSMSRLESTTGRSAARVWGDQLVMSNYPAGCSSAQTVINEIHSKFKGSCVHRVQEQDGCRMAGRGPGSDVIKYQ